MLPERYIAKIQERSFFRYYAGLIVRFVFYCKFGLIRNIARLRGATIGVGSIIPLKLALNANPNLFIGNDTICETAKLDLRGRIEIGDKCIINKQVQILRVSHYIDDNTQFDTRYYPALIIEPYCWLCTGCHILPNVTHIGRGSVISAFSTLAKNTDTMEVIGIDGNVLRRHNAIFENLVVVSLKGGDFESYKNARKH